jgi:hypothetical protein
MISPDDLTQMQNDLLSIRDDNPVSIVLRRGNTDRPAQTVRVVRSSGKAAEPSSGGASEKQGSVLVIGSTSLDIEPEDRFTISGQVYRVTYIRPNRIVSKVAEAELAQ